MSSPHPLWPHVTTLLQRCIAHSWCALCLDYDGTLAPLVADPAAATPPRPMRQALHALLQHPRYVAAVVSGRSCADLRTRIDYTVPYLAGNHGLEILAPGTTYSHADAQPWRARLAGLRDILQQGLAPFPGVWVEDKGLTLTVHWRNAPAAVVPQVQSCVRALLQVDLEKHQVVLRTGKSVLEIRPPVAWNKGHAVGWIVSHMQSRRPDATGLVIYIGDDDTDEDAFHAVRTTGVGIVVGEERQRSAAHYMLPSVMHVAYFLALCASLRWPERVAVSG